MARVTCGPGTREDPNEVNSFGSSSIYLAVRGSATAGPVGPTRLLDRVGRAHGFDQLLL
jgi:hypothetical protein